MSFRSKELREVRAGVAKQLADLVTEAKKSEKGVMTAEQRSSFDKMDGEINRLQEEIESHERMEKFEGALLEETRNHKAIKEYKPHNQTPEKDKFLVWCKAKAGLLSREEEQQHADMDLRSDKFCSHYSEGYTPRYEIRANEPQTISLNSGNFGSHLIPTTLADFVSRYETAVWDVRTIARNITTTGMGNFDVPVINDTGEATLIAEAAADTVIPVGTSKKTLGAYCYTSGMLQISHEMLASTQYDAQAFFAQDLAARLARGRAKSLCQGTGSGQPLGYAYGNTSTGVTLASNTAVTYAELLTALTAVPLFYRANASFVVSDSMQSAIRATVDDSGRPIWSADPYPSIAHNAPGLLMGRPVYCDPYLDAMGANDRTVGIVGDFSNFLVRSVNPAVEIAVSPHRYFEKRVLAVVAFGFWDSTVLQTGAFKRIRTIAT